MQIKKEVKRLKNKDIIIFIPFWGNPKIEKIISAIIKITIPKNFGYMYFSYSKDLLNENPEFTKKNFQNLISTISSDIEKIPDKDTKNFYIYAQSLGGLFGMIISDLVKINKVSLICPGYNLATCFWEGVATNEIRERMVKNNINLNILKEVWREISPDNYFKSKSREAEFNILLSRNDQIIPYGNGKQLVNFLE